MGIEDEMITASYGSNPLHPWDTKWEFYLSHACSIRFGFQNAVLETGILETGRVV